MKVLFIFLITTESFIYCSYLKNLEPLKQHEVLYIIKIHKFWKIKFEINCEVGWQLNIVLKTIRCVAIRMNQHACPIRLK